MDASKPGLVYIWNAVNQESRDLLPTIEAFEQSHPDIKVSKVDVYKSNGIATRLGVSDVPCAVAIKDGKIAGTLSSNITAEALEALVK